MTQQITSGGLTALALFNGNAQNSAVDTIGDPQDLADDTPGNERKLNPRKDNQPSVSPYALGILFDLHEDHRSGILTTEEEETLKKYYHQYLDRGTPDPDENLQSAVKRIVDDLFTAEKINPGTYDLLTKHTNTAM